MFDRNKYTVHRFVGIHGFGDILRLSLRWRHNDQDGVSNHQPHGCLLNRLFRRRSNKTSKLRVTGLCVGNSPGPVNSPHKGPVTRKVFPFDDVIMYTQMTIFKTDTNMHVHGYKKHLYLLSGVILRKNVYEHISSLRSFHFYFFIPMYPRIKIKRFMPMPISSISRWSETWEFDILSNVIQRSLIADKSALVWKIKVANRRQAII